MKLASRRLAFALVLSVVAGACSSGEASITVYSGRTENLIGPLLDEFTAQTGIDVAVKYGSSAELALLISEEGDRSPADVFISQSPGAVGFLVEAGLLGSLNEAVLDMVSREFRNGAGHWVGLSGRIRVLVYNSDLVAPDSLPASVFDLTDERFADRIGVAPGNGSFQDFVTAMRDIHGDDATLAWLEGLESNGAKTYANNTAIVQAVGRGEVPLGLVNHYYNLRALTEDPDVSSRNHFFAEGDVGSLLIATAAGILESSAQSGPALDLIEFLLGESAQSFFSEETLEYPLASGVAPAAGLPPLAELEAATYDFDDLGGGLERTRELIAASGLEAP
ncbi:MAG: extracellular solute-binding protein [Acidimicrobiia bacterium]|nr:extracellular solute-binding protein [Acidimicrobiia bacterium]NNF87292.1 extracellular solute-binding protein [Acidimicrobiia bacterium]NNL13851.1 extracellular solute-binding protein [Acidimicrobiia bacterium]NNL98615.1 extracellular solute-binding protein [Acidimicrobiia bacterium]